MAHKKGGGSSRNNRDSNAQRLGVKRYGGEFVTVRQHHRTPAGQPHPSWHERGHRQGRHALRHLGRFCYIRMGTEEQTPGERLSGKGAVT